MTDRFDYFVVFAEMRTGSNFLEANLNALEGVTCHGEAFNPHFIGYPNRTEILGLTKDARDADPLRLLSTIRDATDGLGGFRYFHDHDPRALTPILDDPRCAKIVLTRNPLDSYVSWKIAQATDQWKLTNVKRRKDGTARFDAAEFEQHVAGLQAFQVELMNALQTRGQTAFYVDYEDLQSLDVMNGLAAWLGVVSRLEALDSTLKRQNPAALEDKIENFDEVAEGLSRLDRFNLTRTPNFEPRRGAAIPGYVAAPEAPLIYLPVRGGPEAAVHRWLAALDGASEDRLRAKFTQKELRQWKRRNRTHRSFTILRHPVARAHAAFCQKILSDGPGSFTHIREVLRKTYKVPVPARGPGKSYDRVAHHDAFLAFLDFVKANLAGQTNVRQDAHWCTQAAVLQGMGDFALPDMVIRESEMPALLPSLAARVGYPDAPVPEADDHGGPFALSDIYDGDIESRASEIYQRDYMMFGFRAWGDDQAA